MAEAKVSLPDDLLSSKSPEDSWTGKGGRLRRREGGFLLEMENCGDFLVNLGLDVSTIVLTQLDDPSDIVRVSSVSSSWRHFVIENHFCKKLCTRLFPEVSRFTRVIEVSNSMEPTEEAGTSNSVAWESLKRDHRIYAHLAQCLMSPLTMKDCIETSIHASSTDNDPEENIENTLDPREMVDGRHSYWSSTGTGDPEVPETLTYKLRSQLCVINEINIRPFEVTFHPGHPICSSKAVRFRMGHPKVPLDWLSRREFVSGGTDDNYVWTYVSPEFPMIQENSLQTFKLPKPVICIGGILQIELLGRIHNCEIDDLYYICPFTHNKLAGKLLLLHVVFAWLQCYGLLECQEEGENGKQILTLPQFCLSIDSPT